MRWRAPAHLKDKSRNPEEGAKTLAFTTLSSRGELCWVSLIHTCPFVQELNRTFRAMHVMHFLLRSGTNLLVQVGPDWKSVVASLLLILSPCGKLCDCLQYE